MRIYSRNKLPKAVKSKDREGEAISPSLGLVTDIGYFVDKFWEPAGVVGTYVVPLEDVIILMGIGLKNQKG